ncbi:hypothetical protein DYY88_02840 [Leptolyngbya iicbica LK]|uniref:Uncharacterized protein n=3 Tax=Cyanophyceae TaxID=3028117 RepID=A0A4V2E3N1_9CYAN|nr:hypothetical protein DYY88_02840 [Leptolyngbya sp. LK]
MSASDDDVRKEALLALTAEFVKQGHPAEYAKYMAMASIFQADLDLRNAQFSGLLHWLQVQHEDIYPAALQVAEGIRQEFENRIQQHS